MGLVFVLAVVLLAAPPATGDGLLQGKVRAGFAWWYYDYAKKDLELALLEREARGARRGLWADPNPVPPWVWRRARRK